MNNQLTRKTTVFGLKCRPGLSAPTGSQSPTWSQWEWLLFSTIVSVKCVTVCVCGECRKPDSLWDCLGWILCSVYLGGAGMLLEFVAASKSRLIFSLKEEFKMSLAPVQGIVPWKIHSASWLLIYWHASQKMWCKLNRERYPENRQVWVQRTVSCRGLVVAFQRCWTQRADCKPAWGCVASKPSMSHFQLESCPKLWSMIASMLCSSEDNH